MLEGLNTAAAGMAAQKQRLDAVGNDLANAGGIGIAPQLFKTLQGGTP
jgi:flagellar basal body rod protein FlgG